METTIGQRVIAAVISHQLGISMDRALKLYARGRELDPSWEELGEALLKSSPAGSVRLPLELGPRLVTSIRKGDVLVNFPVPSVVISLILVERGQRVAENWPLVEAALDAAGIYSPLCAVAAIATIAVETGWFGPTKERGGPAYLTNLYENRSDLGNDQPGDGAKFRGRGFVHIIGRRSYERFGREIGEDLVANPDAVLDPRVAAAVLAVFFKDRDVRTHADQQNWEMVRRRVTRDLTEWPRFIDVVTKLVAAVRNPPPAQDASPEAIAESAQ